METKFIGLEGFNEIESLPTKKRKACKRELTTAQKTVRFVKRAIDRAFRESRSGTTKSAREIVSGLSFKSEKQYAHLAPSTVRSQKLIKKKAVLAVVACFSAITLSCVTVASALDVQ